jgi:hypothetical protein
LTPINFIRGRPPAEADRSGGFILACVVLATLILLLCLIVFFTLRGSGDRQGPGPAAARAHVEAESFAPASASAPATAPAAVPPRPAAPAQGAPAVDRRARMLATLHSAKGAITLKVQDDPAAEATGRRLRDIFQAAGWTVRWNSTFGAGAPLTGLSAALGDSAQDEAVRRAFSEAGIRLGPPPASGMVQAPEIFVGAAAAEPQKR